MGFNLSYPGVRARAAVAGHWSADVRRSTLGRETSRDGRFVRHPTLGLWLPVRERRAWQNIVVNEGLDYLLSAGLAGGAQDTTWFAGLLGSSPTPAAGWTATEVAAADFVNYDEAALQAWTAGSVSGQSVDNSASPAVFTISSGGGTVGGAFLIATNAKATPSGTVYAAGAFTGGNVVLSESDTITVTATFTTADDGA